MKIYESLQVHGNSKIRSLLRDSVKIVLIGVAGYLVFALIFLAIMAILPNPCGSDDAIDMYGCHPDGSM